MKAKLITLGVCYSLFYSNSLFAWEVNTHRAIDRCALSDQCTNDGHQRAINLHQFASRIKIDQDEYDDLLFKDYKLKDDTPARYFSYIEKGNTDISKWGQTFPSYYYHDLIEAGTILEDSLYYNAIATANGRFNNHFYDPQQNGKGLSFHWGDRVDAIKWATKTENLGYIDIIDNEYSYDKAINYLKLGLKSSDTATRKENIGNMFVSLGFLLHLLNDMNVPAHTRNDAHPNGDPLETWMKGGDEPGLDEGGFRVSGSVLSPKNNSQIKSLINNVVAKKHGTFKNFYLVESTFTGWKFFSDDSVLDGLHAPRDNEVDTITRINQPSNIFNYFGSQDIELDSSHRIIGMFGKTFTWGLRNYIKIGGDNTAVIDNGINLIPRAVANAEGFINYFFRGQLLATIENDQLKIANVSNTDLVSNPSIVTFKAGGTISLYFDSPDGTRALQFSKKLAQDLPANGVVSFDFPMSIDEKKLTVVFDGEIGNERGLSATAVDSMRDTDGDGLPDYWEVQHQLDINNDDANADRNNDGVSNIKEFYASDSDGDGFTNWEEKQSGTNPLANTEKPLPAPQNLKLNSGNGTVTLTWDAVKNATSYKVCGSSHGSMKDPNIYGCPVGELFLSEGPTTNTTLTITGLSNEKEYFFQVVANDAYNRSSRASNEVSTTPIKEILTDFNNLTPEVEASTLKVGIDTKDGTLKLAFKDDGNTGQTFPYIWIANSGEGTISKLDVKTGQELGRYRTGPETANGNPSRTTVDLDGNVWVGNRNNNTITKVGLLEFGQCIDRNKNGKIDTSIGGTDVKPWGGSFGDGQGITYAEDECVLQHVNLTAEGVSTPSDIRMLAIDKDNNVFAGGTGVNSIFKVNGATGAIIDAKDTVGSFYGGLVDKNGTVWAASRGTGYGYVIKISNDLQTQELINAGLDVYGIALNKYDEIWVTNAYAPAFASFNTSDPIGTLTTYQQEGRDWQPCYAQGIAVDDKDNIFIAGCASAYDQVVGHYKRIFDGTTHSVQYINNYTVGGGSTGVAVDGFGHIWSSNLFNDSVSRIILATDTTPVQIDTYPVGSQPYNYSDMTGRVVRTITSRQGTWEAIFDSKVEGYNWQQVKWRLKNTLPAGTGVQVYAKTAASSLELNTKPYTEVQNGVTSPELEAGRYLKLKVRLTSNNLTDTPEVVEIQLY